MTEQLNAVYQRQLSDFRLTYSKAGNVTSVVLILAGVGLDHFTYPDRQAEFFLIRLAVVWNIPVACNQATADFIIHSSLYQQDYQREVPDFSVYQKIKIKTQAYSSTHRQLI